MAKEQHIADTPASRAAAARRANADRARKWRESRRARGEPLPRDADAAIAEAVAFLIARSKKSGVNIEGRRVVAIDPADIAIFAKLILEREGQDAGLAGKIVKERMAPRDHHSWPDHFPSLSPGPVEWMRETKRGPWTTPFAQVYAVQLARSPSAPK